MIISWLNKSHTETTRMFAWGLCWTAVFSFLANGFSYLNLMPQHDAVNHTIHFAGTWEVALGRWLLPVYGQIKGAIAVPLLTGILSIFFLGILVSAVCDVAGLVKNYQMMLVAGFFSANASILELNSTFQYVVDAFMLSAALGALGVWVLIKDKRPIRGMLIAILCLLLSLGIYQGEVVVFALMGVLFLIRGAIENRAIKKQFIYIGKLVGVAIAAGFLYFVIFKISCTICQVTPPDTYNSISGLISLSAAEIVECACKDIAELLRFFFGSGCFVGLACRIANILLGILALLGIIVFLINRSVNVINKVIGIMSILVSPILMILMSILMNQREIRFYVDFGIFMAYPILLLMISCINVTNDAIRKGVAVVTGVGGLIVLWSNIVYSNGAYSIQKLTFDRTQVMVSQIMMDLNKIEDYVPGETPVIVLGSLDENDAISSISDDYRQLSAFNKVSTTYTLTLENFVNLMGQKIKIVEDATLEEELRGNRQTVSMPTFPLDGCVIKKDDMVILKLS